ncbi:hypothetical protein GGQ05_003559 [Salinibacter ruber]|jgi:hypothetical protein|uniref:hypothetical protein n=1 Tax=Salinibacter ruber TaxID=146919 RepID=UPI00216A83F6|nr:hypothetical protein [Salinibacter ruber]MCS4172067.1 hypothetical protein [Salinibacter ruber]
MDNPYGHEVEHILGLDLGQSADPSALTVTRRAVPYKESDGTRRRGDPQYAVVWIERFDLGTPYPEVVRRTAAIQRAPETGESPPLVMDATGIGAPVVDAFHEEGLRPVEIVFTSGDSVTQDGDTYRVPKQDLATTVQTLLQSDRLTIAEDLDQAGQLAREMKQFRVKVTPSGHARFEHASETDTDDILLSLACATWYGERQSRAGFVIV